MGQSWKGPVVVGLIVVGGIAILALNFQPGGGTGGRTSAGTAGTTAASLTDPQPTTVGGGSAGVAGMGIPEYPIGDPVIKNQIQVAAVWLDAVTMEGMATGGGPGMIHLEADTRATEANLQGFAKDEFVPYLKINYTLAPATGGEAIATGELLPMVARDGLHYGATLLMPKPGDYKLTYDIQPPSVNGLGRHSDPVTGVAPWWQPFQASFDWKVEPKAPSTGS